ncbi:MAG: hypothetical protein NT136_04145 [Candidatus Moranbacteria bacterium]|nr:hypothetical protein [Candidatus Moranbacteria bacterium]
MGSQILRSVLLKRRRFQKRKQIKEERERPARIKKKNKEKFRIKVVGDKLNTGDLWIFFGYKEVIHF